ncbi:hypothetical protein HKBW3S03_01868 [Candidatus Hakubella thermalkaliphila]|uniref:Uncharacterized protein n=1 Tax=Candidatus Hakubella thermalkaliphila TaxID=2754717 RepID=A0A6V8NS89_9ACTN|nr:hypothetical protein HKBW3S03_01868 [Candidatus Hakubella thermalkaliphila]GFP22883.1 hypothetical protein HKBW3S09_00350 [Candidatus Hakubella thermalkaliphila]GFP38572.1 hypothetical protein HKBW3S47_00273 [Candidatus Hakubella thermalkaliphila]
MAGIINNRKVAGSEIVKQYYDIACERTRLAYEGRLKIRPDKPVYEPTGNLSLARNPFISEGKEYSDCTNRGKIERLTTE